MKNKTLTRLFGGVLALLALTAAAAIYQFGQARSYRQMLSANYQRAFYDLVDYAKTVDATLEKDIHSSSAQHMAQLSSEIWAEAGSAKASMGQLPLSSADLTNLSRFMTQVGDYCHTLSKKAVMGQELTEEEQKNLEVLSEYAKQLVGSLAQMEQQLEGEGVDMWNTATFSLGKSLPTFAEGFTDAENGFAELPSLTYDGPYSDHMATRESVFLQGEEPVTEEQARQIAMDLLGDPQARLSASEGINGTIETYSFRAMGADGAGIDVDVTKKGGYPLYLLNSRHIGDTMLSKEGALRMAQDFLRVQGFTEMKESYSVVQDGIMTVSFAYQQEGYTCYPDLIEVGVAMDDGEIVMLEASGYLMNHDTGRTIPQIVIEREEAERGLNERLTAADYGLAVIPRDDGSEAPVHGFLCSNADGRKYLAYFNTQTGDEEDLLLLIEDENGSLTL